MVFAHGFAFPLIWLRRTKRRGAELTGWLVLYDALHGYFLPRDVRRFSLVAAEDLKETQHQSLPLI